MKNIFKILLISGLVLSTTSCNDFLDQKSESEHTPEAVAKSPYYTSLVLNKVYGELTEEGLYGQLMAITFGANSDIELVDGQDASTTSQTNSERGVCNFNMVAGSWSKIQTAWDKLYEGIEYSNNVIELVNNFDAQSAGETKSNINLMHRYRAEATTLRALLYFDLIRNFGDVPMKFEGTKTDLSNIYVGKTDRDEIMDSLINQVERVLPDLCWAGENSYTTERITKGYAHGLLAQIALQRAGWAIREKAKEGYETAAENSDPTYPTQRPGATERTKYYQLAQTHLNELIGKGLHQLNPSYENEWYLINQRTLDNKYYENLFEVALGLNKSGELGYTIGVRINGSSSRYGKKGNSSGKIKMTAPLFWSYDHKDERRDVTCAPYTLKETDGVMTEAFDKNSPFGIYCGKWDIRKMNEEWRKAALGSTEKVPTGINFVTLRYSQVLLMYAEVMNELNGNPDATTGGVNGLSARDALGMVHERAFAEADKAAAKAYVNNIPSDHDAFFNAIVDENAWEFAGECVRKYELERWNLLSKKIDQFKADYEAQINEYPAKLYYKTIKTPTDVKIDMKSVCWYAAPENTEGYESVTWWGDEASAKNTTKSNLNGKLPYISSYLNTTVKNRYLMPIATSSIADSQGKLSNSYGY